MLDRGARRRRRRGDGRVDARCSVSSSSSAQPVEIQFAIASSGSPRVARRGSLDTRCGVAGVGLPVERGTRPHGVLERLAERGYRSGRRVLAGRLAGWPRRQCCVDESASTSACRVASDEPARVRPPSGVAELPVASVKVSFDSVVGFARWPRRSRAARCAAHGLGDTSSSLGPDRRVDRARRPPDRRRRSVPRTGQSCATWRTGDALDGSGSGAQLVEATP